MPPRYTFLGNAPTPKTIFGMDYGEFISLEPDAQLEVWSEWLHAQPDDTPEEEE